MDFEVHTEQAHVASFANAEDAYLFAHILTWTSIVLALFLSYAFAKPINDLLDAIAKSFASI